jgi:hypothetical protein
MERGMQRRREVRCVWRWIRARCAEEGEGKEGREGGERVDRASMNDWCGQCCPRGMLMVVYCERGGREVPL